MNTSVPAPPSISERTPPDDALDEPTPDISVLVVNYNTENLLAPMWGALMDAHRALHLQVIIVDNASRDGSVALLRGDPRFAPADLVTNGVNVGFGRANNQAVPIARGRYLLLLNTDAFVAPETLETTVAYMDAHPRYGVLVSMSSDRDGLTPVIDQAV